MGWYTNWTSGIGGMTILIVFNNNNNLWQIELNSVSTTYSRYREKMSSGIWSEWCQI